MLLKVLVFYLCSNVLEVRKLGFKVHLFQKDCTWHQRNNTITLYNKLHTCHFCLKKDEFFHESLKWNHSNFKAFTKRLKYRQNLKGKFCLIHAFVSRALFILHYIFELDIIVAKQIRGSILIFILNIHPR